MLALPSDWGFEKGLFFFCGRKMTKTQPYLKFQEPSHLAASCVLCTNIHDDREHFFYSLSL
jgi:hypothetical protein